MLPQVAVDSLSCGKAQIVASPEITACQMLEKVLQLAWGQIVALLLHHP